MQEINAQSVAMTALAMFDGARGTDLYTRWEQHSGEGSIELYGHFAEMADLTERILQAMQIANYPGTFEYEVSYAYGNWFYESLQNGVPLEQDATLKLGELMAKFFAKGEQGTFTDEHRAVIQKMTGYTVPADPVKVEGVNSPHIVVCGNNAFGPFDGETAAHEYAAMKLEESDVYQVMPLI